jgi:hypothetical protein
MSRPTLEEMLESLGIDRDFVAVLEQESIVTRGDDPVAMVERIRVCWTLHDELGVNLAGVEVVLHLLERLGEERQTHLERFRQLKALAAEDAES